VTDCIISPLAVGNNGYPKKSVKRRDGRWVPTNHHRAVYAEAQGVAVEDLDGVVMHLCDTPRCINLEHLKLDTHAANSRDMVDKGRGTAKLTRRQAVAIRHMSNCGMSRQAVADFFGISKSNVHRITRGETWALDLTNSTSK